MSVFAGVDVGSTTGKALLLDDKDNILAHMIMEVTTRPEKTARICVDTVLKDAGLEEKDIAYMVGTGYGRVKIPFASENISEITYHAVGAKWLCPTVRTVVDIGGQLSHGSIVAREYGIPGVLNVMVGTKLIKTGQIITVDGAKGEVYLHE